MKKPNLFIWTILGAFVRIYTYLHGFRILEKVNIKGPAILLVNHNSFKDYLYSTSVVYPHRITYMAAAKMFYEPSRGPFLRLARAIPKAMFQSDLQSIRKTFSILKQKGIVGIYPEGQISYHGTSLKPPYAIAKLIKKAKVNVYVCQLQNAYLYAPPWSKRIFKGKVTARLKLLLNQEAVANLTEPEIFSQVEKGLYFNTGEFNRQSKRTYKVQPIDGLEPLLYQCPSCLVEGMEVNQHQLVCPACRHSLTYDSFGLLNQKSVYQWFELQRQRLEEVIAKQPDYAISSRVRLVRYHGSKLAQVGEGVLRINRQKYDYQGTDRGEQVTYEFTTKTVPYLPADLGKNVQIYAQNEVYIFEVDQPRMSTKMFIAGEYFYRLTQSVS
jgi:1-acyl-sn-glycerol-3-phosphate acyltransferase